LVEVERSKDLTFCCGGGGGRAWLEEHFDPEKGINRINFDRADELIKAGADNIVSACPLCMMMFDEATKRNECESAMANKRLLDIAEIVAEKLEAPKAN
jgi:Fe-S oxidoreductase